LHIACDCVIMGYTKESRMARKAKTKPGKVSMQDLMSLVNKKAGVTVAHDLTGENPTEVKEWIPPARAGWIVLLVKERLQEFL